mmetsp:Transcript_22678/g.68292  ORF Transcript_22678/g.68292 Transcript_22678/m.68292 type:complete len:380 (+) Transcript_22678:857-1996(+)
MLPQVPPVVGVKHHHGAAVETKLREPRQHHPDLVVHPRDGRHVCQPSALCRGVGPRRVRIALKVCTRDSDRGYRMVQGRVLGHVNIFDRRVQIEVRLREAPRGVRFPEANGQQKGPPCGVQICGRPLELGQGIVPDDLVAQGRATGDNAVDRRVDPAPVIQQDHRGILLAPEHRRGAVHVGHALAGRPRQWVLVGGHPVPGPRRCRPALLGVIDLARLRSEVSLMQEVLGHRRPVPAAPHCQIGGRARHTPGRCGEPPRGRGVEEMACRCTGVESPSGTTGQCRALRAALAGASPAGADTHSLERPPRVLLVRLLQPAVRLPEVVDEVEDSGVVWPPTRQERVSRRAAHSLLAVGFVKDHAAIRQRLDVGGVDLGLAVR